MHSKHLSASLLAVCLATVGWVGCGDDDDTMCQPTESREEQCTDGKDGDCDGLVDCADPHCGDNPPCFDATMFDGCSSSSTLEDRCTDDADNDCDGLVDCDDSDCVSMLLMCRDAGSPTDAESKDSGVCVVTDTPREENCSNGVDGDCDELTDCEDDDCAESRFCLDGGTKTDACVISSRIETQCNDDIDNDCDGLIDCADRSCFTARICVDASVCDPSGRTESMCADRVDNDCDGRLDCRDVDCFDSRACLN